MARMILAVTILMSTNLFAQDGMDIVSAYRLMVMQNQNQQIMDNAVEQSRYMGNTGGALPSRGPSNMNYNQYQQNPYLQQQLQQQMQINSGYQGYGYGQ